MVVRTFRGQGHAALRERPGSDSLGKGRLCMWQTSDPLHRWLALFTGTQTPEWCVSIPPGLDDPD